MFRDKITSHCPQENQRLSYLILDPAKIIREHYELVNRLKTGNLLGDIRSVQTVNTIRAHNTLLLRLDKFDDPRFAIFLDKSGCTTKQTT